MQRSMSPPELGELDYEETQLRKNKVKPVLRQADDKPLIYRYDTGLKPTFN